MIEIFKKTNFDFVGKRWIFFGLTLSLFAASIISIVMHKGLNYGVDFTGGTVVELQFTQRLPLSDARKILADGGYACDLQDFPKDNTIIVKLKSTEHGIADKIQEVFAKAIPQNAFVLKHADYVGPTIGKHLKNQAFFALFWAFVGIIVYVGLRFSSGIWGVAGVIALVHDVFITVGFLSVLGKEFTVTIIAVLLTIVGYSINDTVVVFDRMRENMRLYRKDTLFDIINRSVNETLSRTVITSLTVVLVLLALFFFGGEAIHDFSLALLFGVTIGTYSSIFVAAPIVYEWEIRKDVKYKVVKK